MFFCRIISIEVSLQSLYNARPNCIIIGCRNEQFCRLKPIIEIQFDATEEENGEEMKFVHKKWEQTASYLHKH